MRRVQQANSIYVGVHLRNIDLERNGRSILRGINWNIQPGERWILAGGNGAGKTQLLKIIAGAVWPTPTGKQRLTYQWRGETWPGPFEVKDEIGYVGPERQDKYERYGWDHSVAQIVGTGLHRTDIPLNTLTPGDHKRIQALLHKLGIEAFAPRPFLSLSYGERRLVLLARTLASRSKLLLLDELLNGLDEVNRTRALRWLQQTKRSQLPWVLTTHRVEDVPEGVTHALVLEGGRIVYRGKALAAPLKKWLQDAHDKPVVTATPATPSRRRSASRGAPLLRLIEAAVYLDEHIALQDISFEVHKGECWVVHGRNGSGKTTLLRTLYGDHGVAAGGRIERAGIQPGVPLQVFKTRVGIVAPHLQSRHPQEMTVTEVVQSGRHASIGLNESPTAADRSAAAKALEFFGLSGFASRTLVELSYGQMRRVLFARAWVRRPQLLLLDEPYSGLDGPTRVDLQGHVEALLRQGTAVVIATHHRSEWPVLATHELELSRGHMVYCGPVRFADRIAGG